MLASTIKFFKDNKLHSCYNFAFALHEKWTCFQQVRRALFFQVFYYTQVESEISDQVTDGKKKPTRQKAKGKANERFVSMPSAKKQRKHSTTSRVSPFVLQLLAAALQQNKASLFFFIRHPFTIEIIVI